jgi:hypothetical protein
MKARELPDDPNEPSELRNEIVDIATEARDPDPRAHLVASACATAKGRVVGVLSFISRVKKALLGSGAATPPTRDGPHAPIRGR